MGSSTISTCGSPTSARASIARASSPPDRVVARLQALAQGGKLVVASVHDLTLAARFSTRILALRGGRVTADGPTAATLTAQLLRQTFDVEARVSGHGRDAVVDFIAPASP